MAFGYNANQVNMPSPQQNTQPLFPPPQGNVYSINSTLEVANVPVGAGMSIALCLPENVMYIKTMQNGNPMFYPYKLVPFTNSSQQETKEKPLEQAEDKIPALENRIKKLEETLQKLSKKECDFEV